MLACTVEQRTLSHKLSLLQLIKSQENQLESKTKIINELKEKHRNSTIKKEECIKTLEMWLQDAKSKLEQAKMNILGIVEKKNTFTERAR